MTIKRGADWGAAMALPATAPVARSDAELADLARRREPKDPIGLLAGDLARTIGATGDQQRLFGPQARTMPCDAMAVSIDSAGPILAVGALVIGTTRWGRFVIVANAAWLGAWNINPRSHPNDGRVEVIDSRSLSIADGFKAKRRFTTGTHLPHPDIVTRSVTSWTIRFSRPAHYQLDGAIRGRARDFAVEVLADRISVVI